MTKQIHTRHLPVPYMVGTGATQLDEWQKAVGEAQEGWLGITTYLSGLTRPTTARTHRLFRAEAVEAWREAAGVVA